MHLLEALLYVLSLTFLIIIMSKKLVKKEYVIALFGVMIMIIVLHLIIDGTRWQLYMLYLAILLMSIIIIIKTILNINLTKRIKILSNIVLISLFSISLIAAIVFPVYELPTPNGSYLIGTESFIIEDENRLEIYGDDSTANRRIKIQIWYPAESIEGYEQVPWLEDGTDVSRGLSKDYGFPAFMLDHMADIMSNSYSEAPISSSLTNYPVIIISHGWSGFRNLHTDYAEELASLGYIVVGIDHTYGSVATVFGENDIAYKNPDALPSRETTTDFLDYANQLVYTYASDITLTIDYLESLNDNTIPSRFNGKFNLDHIGLLGHSTGAGAGVAVAINDVRIDSIIGLDPWVEPIEENEINKGLLVPSLFLRSEMWETGDNNINLYSIANSSAFDSALYQIDGTTHFDFTMIYMFSPLTKYIGMSGKIENEYLNSILKSMITDYFNQTLKNDTNSQINIEDWEEVRIIPVQ